MARLAKHRGAILACVVALLLGGCGKKDQEQDSAPSNPSATAEQPTRSNGDSPTAVIPDQGRPSAQTPPAGAPVLPAEAAQALQQMDQGKVVEPLTVEAIKAFLPAAVPGMSRTDASGERTQMMNVTVTMAQAEYRVPQASGEITIVIMDVGNVSGPMRMGMAGWALTDLDRQTDTGYEKTISYAGCRGLEEYDTSVQDGSVKLFVADRFLLDVQGTGVPMETIKQALGKLDIKALATTAGGS